MAFASSCDALGHAAESAFFFARLNSKFETGIKSPLDTAILEQPEQPDALGYTKVDEIPFDFERRRLSIVVERAGQRQLISKGSPEGILECATRFAAEQGAEMPLDAAARTKCRAVYESLGSRGFRVLAVATSPVTVKPSYKKEGTSASLRCSAFWRLRIRRGRRQGSHRVAQRRRSARGRAHR